MTVNEEYTKHRQRKTKKGEEGGCAGSKCYNPRLVTIECKAGVLRRRGIKNEHWWCAMKAPSF